MNRLLILLFAALITAGCQAAERVTLTVTLTNAPADADSLTVIGAVRTWKDAVATPATQIATGGDVGSSATNLFNQVAANPISDSYGPLIVQRNGANAVNFIGQVGQAISASISGTWAELSYSTQMVTQLTPVRVPILAEPYAPTRTNVASLIVSNVFNSGLSTEKILASSSVMDNFVDTSENQTIAGNKTFTGKVSLNVVTANTFEYFYLTNGVIVFEPGYFYLLFPDGGDNKIIKADASGFPSLVSGLGDVVASTPASSNLVSKAMGDTVWGQLSQPNAWTGTNSFAEITNSFVIGSVITNSTIYGTLGTLTNGNLVAPTITNGVARGSAFQSYVNSSSNLELGSGAAVTNSFTGAIAAGQNAKAGANNAAALGNGAVAAYANSTALGASAATTKANQIRLGTASEEVSAPNDLHVGDNLSIGDAAATFPASLARGALITDGTAASADPSAGAAIWSESGGLKYRTSGSSEGAGAANSVHNRAAQVVGSGSDYAFSGTSYARADFGGTDPEIVLPTAGTYLVTAIVSIINGGTANDAYSVKLYNSTDAADISSSERDVSSVAASQVIQVVVQNVVTVTGSKTIQVYAKNATAARGSVDADHTTISYVRLH